MRVYYFTSEEFGLSNIINERLKISLLNELNDPFEFLAVDVSNKPFRKIFNAAREEVAKEAGVICFCRDWKNPLMWAHYGDKHKGICLGFDIDEKHIKSIKYLPERITQEFDIEAKYGGLTKEQLTKQLEELMCMKYIDWEYENELRVIAPLETPDSSGLFFTDFKDNMELKEVFLGPRSSLKVEQIAKYLRSYKTSVNVYKSRIAFTKYEVVKDKSQEVYIHSAS